MLDYDKARELDQCALDDFAQLAEAALAEEKMDDHLHYGRMYHRQAEFMKRTYGDDPRPTE